MKLSIFDVKKYESMINSVPSHDIILTDELINKLNDIADNQTNVHGLPISSIPAHMLISGHVPAPDIYIRLSEFSARARIVIFNKCCGCNKNKQVVCGAVIYDYGNTMPEIFFSTSLNTETIKVDTNEWWFGARTVKEKRMFRARFGEENMGMLKMTERVVRIWFAIQTVYMFNGIFPNEFFQLKHQIYRSISELDLFPKKMIQENEDLKKYQRHKMYWFQIGYYRTVKRNGRYITEWIDGGWREAQYTNEECKENIERIKREIEKKKKKNKGKKI